MTLKGRLFTFRGSELAKRKQATFQTLGFNAKSLRELKEFNSRRLFALNPIDHFLIRSFNSFSARTLISELASFAGKSFI